MSAFDWTTFDQAAEKFRKGSPNIYTAVTELKKAVLYTPPDDQPPTLAAPVGPFTVLDGNFARGSFEQAFPRGVDPFTVRKLHVKDVTGYGVGSMQYYPPSVENPARTAVEDCIVEDIGPSAGAPPVLDGRGEAGFWFGNPTAAKRLIAKRCAWMGMWTGSKCRDSMIEDFELLEQPHVGLYVEHVTERATFRRFRIHAQHTGINVEWWYGGHGSHTLTFEDGDIYCPAGSHWTHGGVFVDAGTYGVTFRRCRFHGPGKAIQVPRNRVGNGPDLVIDNCVFDQDGPDVTYHDNQIG